MTKKELSKLLVSKAWDLKRSIIDDNNRYELSKTKEQKNTYLQMISYHQGKLSALITVIELLKESK
jgi:hypothetical protein